MSNYDNTIFKSSYYYGNTLHQLFINYGYANKPTFSFVMMRAKSSFIHNTTEDEIVPMLKNMVSKLSNEQLEKIGVRRNV